MKTLATFLITTLLVLPASWLTNFDQAKTEAAQANKLILLNFSGSDWCGPCIRMKKEIFEAESFQAFAAEHLVLVRADFPRQKKNQLDKQQIQHNEALADQYNPNGKFPYTVLLDAQGKVLKEWDGFSQQTPGDFTNEIMAFLHARH